MSRGRTTTDVLMYLLEELLMGPTAAQPQDDATATHHDRCGHLLEEQSKVNLMVS